MPSITREGDGEGDEEGEELKRWLRFQDLPAGVPPGRGLPGLAASGLYIRKKQRIEND